MIPRRHSNESLFFPGSALHYLGPAHVNLQSVSLAISQDDKNHLPTSLDHGEIHEMS